MYLFKERLFHACPRYNVLASHRELVLHVTLSFFKIADKGTMEVTLAGVSSL